jgi:hypothetical protein
MATAKSAIIMNTGKIISDGNSGIAQTFDAISLDRTMVIKPV